MASKRALTDALPLINSSVKIPQLGFGVYQSPPDVCVASCLAALKAGYRHIDTAQYYANEKEVGHAIKQSGLQRHELFITTKILSAGGSVEKSFAKCAKSVQLLDDTQGGFVDCFLVHSPNGGDKARKEMWLALEKLLDEGKVKSIGVSNYGIKHIEEMKQFAKHWPPQINQIELHPWNQQREIVKYCEDNGIVVEAYCPIVRNQKAGDPTVKSLAQKHGVTENQVLIRYCLQKGWVPLPKSDNPERIKQNADLYGFDLGQEQMKVLDGLDQGAAGAIVQAVTNE